MHIFRQLPPAGGEDGRFQGQHALPARHGGRLREGEEHRLFQFRQGGEGLALALKAPAHGLHGVHFLLQKPAGVRVLPRKRGLVVLHLLADAAEALHLGVELLALLASRLLLALERAGARGDVFAVGQAGHRGARQRFAPQQLQVQHHRRAALQQRLVVGDEERRLAAAEEEVLQPLQRGQVEVVRRLVQQQHVRLRGEHARQAQLHPLAAGEGAQRPLEGKRARRQAQRALQRRALAAVQSAEGRRTREISRRRQGQLALVRLLWEIAGAVAAEGEAARVFGVGLDQRGVVEQLQKRGFAVALLANNGAALAGAEVQAEVGNYRAQVAPARYAEVIYGKHTASAPLIVISAPGRQASRARGEARKNARPITGCGRAERAHAI